MGLQFPDFQESLDTVAVVRTGTSHELLTDVAPCSELMGTLIFTDNQRTTVMVDSEGWCRRYSVFRGDQ